MKVLDKQKNLIKSGTLDEISSFINYYKFTVDIEALTKRALSFCTDRNLSVDDSIYQLWQEKPFKYIYNLRRNPIFDFTAKTNYIDLALIFETLVNIGEPFNIINFYTSYKSNLKFEAELQQRAFDTLYTWCPSHKTGCNLAIDFLNMCDNVNVEKFQHYLITNKMFDELLKITDKKGFALNRVVPSIAKFKTLSLCNKLKTIINDKSEEKTIQPQLYDRMVKAIDDRKKVIFEKIKLKKLLKQRKIELKNEFEQQKTFL